MDIIKCSNLKVLNNTFNNLVDLEITHQNHIDFSQLKAPSLTQLSMEQTAMTTFDTKIFPSLETFIAIGGSINKIIIQNPVDYF